MFTKFNVKNLMMSYCVTIFVEIQMESNVIYHLGSAADVRGKTVAYRGAPEHTVSPPELHREGNVAYHSITGTDRDHFLPQNGSGP